VPRRYPIPPNLTGFEKYGGRTRPAHIYVRGSESGNHDAVSKGRRNRRHSTCRKTGSLRSVSESMPAGHPSAPFLFAPISFCLALEAGAAGFLLLSSAASCRRASRIGYREDDLWGTDDGLSVYSGFAKRHTGIRHYDGLATGAALRLTYESVTETCTRRSFGSST
jgi:hypothetical protein